MLRIGTPGFVTVVNARTGRIGTSILLTGAPGTDAAIPHLREFSARIHRHGCAIMCQITHLGRRGEDTAGWWLPTIAPTRSRETLHRSFAREMDRHDIARVVSAFGDAAARCREGGLDGIETMAAGHLIPHVQLAAID